MRIEPRANDRAGFGIATTAGTPADQLARAAERLARDAAGQAGQADSARDLPREFSKLLATMLVKEMRQALPEGFFGAGSGADVYDGWLDEHVGAALAERDGLRLEELIARSMRVKTAPEETVSTDAPHATDATETRATAAPRAEERAP